MKILKPGKVEQRKFVCRHCGCVFVAHRNETEFLTVKNAPYVFCPTCTFTQSWYDGEPYEEPTQDKNADRDELIRLLCEHCDANYNEAADVAQILIANGVTFRD